MDLTVLITCKDRIKNLRWCLQSITQCSPRPELLLVDFGNEPPLEHLKETYGDWLKIIRAIHNTKGFHKTRALNIGIKNIKTKYVCMTDSDQIFQPNFFGIVEHVLKNNPTAFVQCKTFFLRGLLGNVTPFDLTPALYYKMLEYAKRDNFKKPHGEGCCHGVAHEWLMTVNGHDEKYIGWGYEDKDLVLRATHSGRQVLWIDHATSMVHISHNRDMSYFGFEVRNKNKLYYQSKLGHVLPIVNINCTWGEI